MKPERLADAVIIGVGARTASGLTALQVTMSARARKFAPRESHMIDMRGEPIATARLMSIGDHVVGIERFLALGVPPLVQATHPLRSAHVKPGAPIPVILALPSQDRPGFDPRLPQHLLPALEARSRVPIDRERSRLVFGGRGSGAEAVALALAELRSGARAAVVVGGIDSYFDPDVLDHLDEQLRLHGPATENGFVPGEGAGFLSLVASTAAGPCERLGRVLSAVVEDEPRPWGSDKPCLALGMTQAIRRAVAALDGEARRTPWLLTDVANERHRVEEWMYAWMRSAAVLTEDVVHEQPLLKTGDLGAASTAVLLVMASVRWQTGCAPGDSALVATHSDGPQRGVVIAAAEPAQRQRPAPPRLG